MLYVDLELRASTYNQRSTPAEERKVTLGPFSELRRGYECDILGIGPAGSEVTVFSAAVAHGGYCDTCAYDYPDFAAHYGGKSWDVISFVIRAEASGAN